MVFGNIGGATAPLAPPPTTRMIVPCAHHVCRSPSSAVIEQKGQETDFLGFFVISGRSRNGNPDFLVPLESLGQAGSAGTLQMSVGAPVEPQ